MIQVLMYAFRVFCHRQQFIPAGIGANRQFHADFSGDGDFVLRRLPIFDALEPGLDFASPYPGRASGTYISPNNFAGFLEMLLPLAMAYVLAGRMNPVVADFARLLGSGHAGGDGGDVFARRLGGGCRGVAGAFGNIDFSSQPPVAGLFAFGRFGRGAERFSSPIICRRRSVTCARVEETPRNSRRNLTWWSGPASGRRRSKCGGIIFGGVSGRRITIIVSGNIVRNVSRLQSRPRAQ